MINSAQLKAILKEVTAKKHWNSHALSETDNKLIGILNEYTMLSVSDRHIFKNQITDDLCGLLLYFSERLATHILRTSDYNLINVGLYALDTVYGIFDIREILPVVSLYYDLSKRNHLKFTHIISSEYALSACLHDFSMRKGNDKSFETMGYVLSDTEPGGLAYKRTW